MRIRTEVLIDAPLDVVWRAFNDPAEITQWDASDDWRTTWASNDLRVGGLLRLRIEPRHGEAGFDFAATYMWVEPMRRIDWRMEDGRHVRVDFRETGAGVMVNQAFDAEAVPSIEEQYRDWQGVLESFACHAAAIAERAGTGGRGGASPARTPPRSI